MSLQLHGRGPGGLEPRGVEQKNWRRELRSRRWRAAPLENTEAKPTSTWGAVAFFLALGLLTFAILLVGYGIRFWTL